MASAVLPKRTFCDKCSYYFATVHGTQSDGYAHGRGLTSNSTHSCIDSGPQTVGLDAVTHATCFRLWGHRGSAAGLDPGCLSLSLPSLLSLKVFWVVVENLLFFIAFRLDDVYFPSSPTCNPVQDLTIETTIDHAVRFFFY